MPGEVVIDPWSHGYTREILATGSTIRRQTVVTGGQLAGDHWQIETTSGPVQATTIINCVGLLGDRIDALFLGQTHFTIKPRKGAIRGVGQGRSQVLNTIILPVPDARTKGVVLTSTIFDNLFVGPPATSPPRMPNLAEHLPRDRQTPGYGEIICHCEMVTRREIELALNSPFPSGNLGGLKRRTRRAMGRSQGFNCM